MIVVELIKPYQCHIDDVVTTDTADTDSDDDDDSADAEDSADETSDLLLASESTAEQSLASASKH